MQRSRLTSTLQSFPQPDQCLPFAYLHARIYPVLE